MALKRDHYVVVNKSQRQSTETVNIPTAAPAETVGESPTAHPVAAEGATGPAASAATESQQ